MRQHKIHHREKFLDSIKTTTADIDYHSWHHSSWNNWYLQRIRPEVVEPYRWMQPTLKYRYSKHLRTIKHLDDLQRPENGRGHSVTLNHLSTLAPSALLPLFRYLPPSSRLGAHFFPHHSTRSETADCRSTCELQSIVDDYTYLLLADAVPHVWTFWPIISILEND